MTKEEATFKDHSQEVVKKTSNLSLCEGRIIKMIALAVFVLQPSKIRICQRRTLYEIVDCIEEMNYETANSREIWENIYNSHINILYY